MKNPPYNYMKEAPKVLQFINMFMTNDFVENVDF